MTDRTNIHTAVHQSELSLRACRPLPSSTSILFPSPFIPSTCLPLPHHADLGHLSFQLGSRHVLEVVVIAALPAPRVRLHDEVLHVQRSAWDPCRVRCLAHRRAELGGSLVPGLLGPNQVLDGTAFVSLKMQIHMKISHHPILISSQMGMFQLES